jgi:hypothetical protein
VPNLYCPVTVNTYKGWSGEDFVSHGWGSTGDVGEAHGDRGRFYYPEKFLAISSSRLWTKNI